MKRKGGIIVLPGVWLVCVPVVAKPHTAGHGKLIPGLVSMVTRWRT